MSDGGNWVEIVLLAMLAGFIGLRLVSVLGRRTGHEKPVSDAYSPASAEVLPLNPANPSNRELREIAFPAGTSPDVRASLQAMANADASFDPAQFITGASAAYQIILEAYWAGDAAAMDGLVSDEVMGQFTHAIAARPAADRKIGNRLDEVTATVITAAQMVGQMAEVTVRVDAKVSDASDVKSVTHDVWTFSRHIGTAGPAWLLIATDDEG
jgi:predicted lipid-binding transport protein (Tim44 family)